MKNTPEHRILVLEALLKEEVVHAVDKSLAIFKWDTKKLGIPQFDKYTYLLQGEFFDEQVVIDLNSGSEQPYKNLLRSLGQNEIRVRKILTPGGNMALQIVETGSAVHLMDPVVNTPFVFDAGKSAIVNAETRYRKMLLADPKSRGVTETWHALKDKYKDDRHLSAVCTNGMVKFVPARRGTSAHERIFRAFIRHRGVVMVSRELVSIREMGNYHGSWGRVFRDIDTTFSITTKASPGQARTVVFDIYRAEKGFR